MTEPPSSWLFEPGKHPFETSAGRELLRLLDECETLDDWQRAVGALVHALLVTVRSIRPDLPDIPESALRRWVGLEAMIARRIAGGPRRPKRRPQAVMQTYDDARYLDLARLLNEDFAPAAAALAAAAGIPLPQARKRLEAAERRSGRRLPRRKPFAAGPHWK